MSKHTPGKWVAVGAWVELADDNRADICTCNPDNFGQAYLNRSFEESCANARFIASAPQLLEALEHIAASLYYNDYGDPALLNSFDESIIDAAIKAARGEA